MHTTSKSLAERLSTRLDGVLGLFDSENKRAWLAYLWLVLISLLSYSLLIPWLGFYWDAIPYLYQYHTFGVEGFPAFVASDRPFSAWIFMLTTTLFGYEPLGYQLLALMLRILASLLFFNLLRMIYADRPNLALAAGSLFAVYPGFLQQPVAFIYIHHLSALCFYLASIYLMLCAYKTKHTHYVLLCFSWLVALHPFYLEYFVLLELARPFILWKWLHDRQEDDKGIFKLVVRRWLPYALIFVGFLFWRVFVLQFSNYQPSLLDALRSDWWSAVKSLLLRLPGDLNTATLSAWVNVLKASSSKDLGSSARVVYWVILAFVFFSTLLMQSIWARFQKGIADGKKWPVLAHGLGLFFLAGGIVWLLEFPLSIDFPSNRMLLAFMPAAALLLGGLLTLFSSKPWLQRTILAGLVALAVGKHFENAFGFRYEWEDFHPFMWQLKWRIPELKEDTMLLTDQLPLRYYSDNSLSFAFNWMYEVPENSQDLPYLILFSEARLGSSLAALEPHIEVYKDFRNFTFNGSTDRMIVFYHQPPGCVHVLDPEVDIHNPLVPGQISQVVSLSRLDLIRDDVPEPVQWEIREEPHHGWCYYYQKGSLAAQNQNWIRAAQLGDTGFSLDEYPNDAAERLPFIEAYAMTGQWEKALQYSALTIEISELNQPMLCALWQRINANLPDSREKLQALKEVTSLSQCQP